MSARPLKIGNAQAFWGDDPAAPARLVAQQSDLDYLTLDYLAEVSMSILAKQRSRDPQLGYARDFLDVVRSLVPSWQSGRRFKLVTNAGGLNPEGCARAVAAILRENGCGQSKVGVVTGDDVLPQLLASRTPTPGTPGEGGGEGSSRAVSPFSHLETGVRLSTVLDRLTTANAYLGARPIVDALARGADVVVTGRTADPSLAVAPAAHHFGWSMTGFDQLAGATIAGHLIECGTQVTGGISTDWLDAPDLGNLGFPVVEVHEDGSCVVTKPPSTGGRVTQATVKEQLLYEIADPQCYLSPDATVNVLTLKLEDAGHDRVRVSGATGSPPPDTYKVSATYRAGYRASGTLTVVGRDALAKARRCADLVRQRLVGANALPEQFVAECLGAGDISGVPNPAATEIVLRLAAADSRKDVVETFTRHLMPLITAGPQGTTGYADGRPQVREVFAYWPTLIPRALVAPKVELL